MFSWLKKHFIPHHGNDHRPHILRTNNIRNIFILILFFEIFSFLIPAISNISFTGGVAQVLPSVLGELTNKERQAQDLAPLTINPTLTRAAEMKAQDMASKGYFAHTSPEGLTPWYWIKLAGYNYQYAGENLAVNFSDSKDVTKAWLNSPSHKANIVKGNYTEIGTGVAKGTYKGKKSVFVAQVYANPMPENSKKNAGSAIVSSPKTNSSNILGAAAEPRLEEESRAPILAEEPALWQELLASPRNTTNVIMAGIFSIIALALFLYLILKAKNHSKDLVGNGLAILAIIGAIIAVNYHLSYKNMVITQSLDYSAETE